MDSICWDIYCQTDETKFLVDFRGQMCCWHLKINCFAFTLSISNFIHGGLYLTLLWQNVLRETFLHTAQWYSVTTVTADHHFSINSNNSTPHNRFTQHNTSKFATQCNTTKHMQGNNEELKRFCSFLRYAWFDLVVGWSIWFAIKIPIYKRHQKIQCVAPPCLLFYNSV